MSVQPVQSPMIQNFGLTAQQSVQLGQLLQMTTGVDQASKRLETILQRCARDGTSYKAAFQDPRTRRLLSLLLHHSRRRHGKVRNRKALAKILLRDLRHLRKGLLRARRMLQRMLQPNGRLPDAIRNRHGDATANQVNDILNSNRSLEEKFMLVCSLLADKMEKEIETQMKNWNQALNGQSKKTGGKGFFGKFLKILDFAKPIIAAVNPAAGLAISGLETLSSGGKSTQKSSQGQAKQIETKIQMMMQRLNRLMAMISNCMSANHKAKMASINNIRA